LTVWDGLLVNFFGFLLISFFMVLNGRVGAVYHIGFPVYSRASFGVFGALWPAFNRALSAIVWNGVNCVQGGQGVYIMLHAIFPSIARLPNHMSKSSALDTANMAGFFLFWGALSAVLFLSIPKWRILIHIKLVAYIISSCSMLAMAIVHAGGVGTLLTEKSTVHGSERAWLIARFTLLSAAGCSTFASNASDWQRNARRPNDPIFGQIFGFPLSNFIVSLFGNIVAATSKKVYGELIWNPLTYLDRILTDHYSEAKYRAGAFFIAFGFVYSALFSCAFENVLPAGNDISSILPKYISIRRAFAICQALTIAICPWYLLGSASIFISFLASYVSRENQLSSLFELTMLQQIFLFAITGILLVDYYIVSKGRMELGHLFSSNTEGMYCKFGCLSIGEKRGN
jgi:NCS1 family nucleobase:cation symporter-1